MELTVKQRLVRYLAEKGIGQNKFERLAGISNGYIYNLKSTPKEGQLTKILQAAPDLNRVWLLTGEGEMLNTDVAPVQAAEAVEEVTVNSHGNKFMQTPSGMLMEVPVVPFAAMGSPLDEFAELIRNNGFEHVSFPVDGVHHGSYYAFRVEGDSMDDGTRDSFQPGDIVLVRELDRSDWAPRLHFGKWPYWVICWGNCVRLKQITAHDEAGSTITCHSLNPSPEFTDFTLRLSDVHRLFNVIQVVPKPRVFSFT